MQDSHSAALCPDFTTVDPAQYGLYIVPMSTEGQPTSAESELKRLEALLDDLIRTCDGLHAENRNLRTKNSDLNTERGQLIEKNELAKSRVEAMISHLRSMEQST